MITSFQKIKGIGRYANYIASNVPLEQKSSNFQHFNLIYGENGTGKTTLAHILRSLKGNNEFLIKKKTFGFIDSPEVIINTKRLVDAPLIYQNFQWQEHDSNIEIFDVHFINNNIYTGLEIQNDHKKKLFEIILGDNGVQLKNEIQAIKLRIRNGNKVVREASRALETNIDNAFLALDYANLSADTAIDEKIRLKEKELQTASNHQVIQEKAALAPLPNIRLPFDLSSAKTILQQSLDFISADYLEKFKTHKTYLNMGSKTEDWLQQGFAAKYDDKCPFCLQKMDDSVEILQAYQQYFNATYKQLIVDIEKINTALTHFNLEAILLQIENVLTVNWGLLEFWKKYLAKAPTLLPIAAEKSQLIEAFEKVKNLFQQKLGNPVQALELTDLQAFETHFTELSDKMNGMNALISNYNESIELMKAHGDTDVLRIEKELKELQAIKKRDEPAIVEHCNNLLTYTTAIANLKTQNEAKKKQLNQFKGIVFNSYLTIINRHLKHFAPYLSLQKLTSGYMGSSTEPVVKFALCINGREVIHKEKGDRPSMKYSLSEGDKNALALAFFLAKLEADEQLQNKIIVFDDTVSNFDRNRMSKLLDQLITFGQKGRQLFFLTHNLRLGQEFIRRVEKGNLPVTKCQLQFFKDTMNIVNFS